ncbi:hypothetical protein [Plantibacter sp. M259]|uniref:hypothetical protein n=1 Tax=Plantibacter sp. M259 TaxID=2583822 RepID=UPI001110EDD2|nr:hypothetical protein [Plantibacter sp. M259]
MNIAVRSWLAIDTRAATAALGVIGALPALSPLLARAPHIGGDSWGVSVGNRRTGEVMSLSGQGQSVATGRLAAAAAERLIERRQRGALTMADVITLRQLRGLTGVSFSSKQGPM